MAELSAEVVKEHGTLRSMEYWLDEDGPEGHVPW